MSVFAPSLSFMRTILDTNRPVCAYIHDLEGLHQYASALVKGLPDGSEFFYAIKANSDPAILQALKPVVAGFEVASAGEILKVRKALGKDTRIIMGGPGRTESDFATALEQGVERVHIESLHLLHLANAVAKRHGKVLPVLLRVNLNGPVPGATITMGGQATQFGIEESQLSEAMTFMKACTNLRFDGFHLHTISNNLDAGAHAVFCIEALKRARGWANSASLPLKVVNLGGGWGVDYSDLSKRFDVSKFAELITPHIEPGGPVLQFECGRVVVAYCAVYATEVIDIKENHGKTFALLRGGSHHFRLPSAWQHRHPHVLLKSSVWTRQWQRPVAENTAVTFTGELCTPKDVLIRDEPVSSVSVGDVVCFLAAGAYGWDISHHDFLSNAHPERHFLIPDDASTERLSA